MAKTAAKKIEERESYLLLIVRLPKPQMIKANKYSFRNNFKTTLSQLFTISSWNY